MVHSGNNLFIFLNTCLPNFVNYDINGHVQITCQYACVLIWCVIIIRCYCLLFTIIYALIGCLLTFKVSSVCVFVCLCGHRYHKKSL